MDEILPGVWHWRTLHPHIHAEVDSYWLAPERVAIDPFLPPDGADWFAAHGGPPTAVVLSCRHHWRGSGDLVERYGIGVHVNRNGLHEFSHGEPVAGFDPGDEPVPGVQAVLIDALSPDETALYLPAHRALVCADGVVRFGGTDLGVVPDHLMGDDPGAVKAGLAAAFSRALDLDFEHLLLAHGGPVVGDGKERLRAWVTRLAAGG